MSEKLDSNNPLLIGVSERDKEMFIMRMEKGMKYKDIATHFKLKSGVTVSRRIKKIQKLLQGMEKGIKSGKIVLENTGVVPSNRSNSNAVAMRLPDQNPFLALDTFEDLGRIASAGGSVVGAGAAILVEGFTREDLPYEERQKMVLKGGGVIASSLLSLFLTFNKFTSESQREMRDATQSNATQSGGAS